MSFIYTFIHSFIIYRLPRVMRLWKHQHGEGGAEQEPDNVSRSKQMLNQFSNFTGQRLKSQFALLSP